MITVWTSVYILFDRVLSMFFDQRQQHAQEINGEVGLLLCVLTYKGCRDQQTAVQSPLTCSGTRRWWSIVMEAANSRIKARLRGPRVDAAPPSLMEMAASVEQTDKPIGDLYLPLSGCTLCFRAFA